MSAAGTLRLYDDCTRTDDGPDRFSGCEVAYWPEGLGEGAGDNPEPGPEPARAEPALDASPEPRALAGLRVLIVEDEALVALDLEDMLENLGMQVVGMALDADEAVRLAGTLRPDCITMDIRIQGERDGIDAATEIWALYGIRSLLVSAYGNGQTLERAAPANPIGLVPKPINRARLAKALMAFRG